MMSFSWRWAWRDLPHALVPSDPAPKPEVVWDRTIADLHARAHAIGVDVLDLRGEPRTRHVEPRIWGWFRDDDPRRNIPSRGRARGTLPWRKRTALMLHRTGVEMGSRRFLGCPCHAAIAHDGTIVLCHPLDAYVWHGHAANRFSVGVEISSQDGAITDEQTAASLLLCRTIVAEMTRHNRLPAIMAHRQSHRFRVNDPGHEIWERVAHPLIADYGLEIGPVVGSGRPLPLRGAPW
jgi:hypothetical protein